MYRKIIINAVEHETRVALLEDGNIAELFIERGDASDIAGNIYKGRVQRVLPGMQAAFVDIGLQQAAFLYVNDVIGGNYSEIENFLIKRNGDEKDALDIDADGSFSPLIRRERHIEELITEGQEIMVQAAKAPMGSKGARLTTHISLPGRLLVLMPTSEHIGISRRIEDEAERHRLKEIIGSIREDNFGYIVRTAAEGAQKEKLEYEMGFLKNLWESIQKKYSTAPAFSLLHKEVAVSLRAVRDLLVDEAEKLIIDSRLGYESILNFLDTFKPSLKDSVELYEGLEPIFDGYNLEGDISRALKRKVWLKSGGYIVIEHTEALVAIDVNTGRYVGKHNLEETILKTNLEAVKEIAYQIRLRDIGGIIIIDFIDMEKKLNQEKVFNALSKLLKKDRSKTHVLPISELGLIQMTRKRTRQPLTRILCEPCFYCDGEGYLISRQSICYNIFREILRESHDMMGVKISLRVNPEIADLLHGEESQVIVELERIIGKQIVIYPASQLHMEEFDIFEIYKE
ncbi:MAG: Rne/Rng family ribonuclease [Deltaproteobacteria bacterium]|jgi:ribonuclease G|nr:Rne/Rng family ribonuclease [Deltaproteobacteria bacterium]MBW2237707.1 Rne/Rng family ribonuclease [Deltaproteobacteria bacterium]MBW2571939.1 Rne/Rng family ribonuclease [Deltaproteobacteria bacterium]MBW2669010.1 Rne/Rng family ribonuclease [Deltaproteobacteria bacterium]